MIEKEFKDRFHPVLYKLISQIAPERTGNIVSNKLNCKIEKDFIQFNRGECAQTEEVHFLVEKFYIPAARVILDYLQVICFFVIS